MPKFYPPSELPPMRKKQTDATTQTSPPPVTWKRLMIHVFISIVLGSIVSFLGIRLTGSIAFFAVFPIALAVGIYIAKNPSGSAIEKPESASKGPVLW
jgi:hypothetical protein